MPIESILQCRDSETGLTICPVGLINPEVALWVRYASMSEQLHTPLSDGSLENQHNKFIQMYHIYTSTKSNIEALLLKRANNPNKRGATNAH